MPRTVKGPDGVLHSFPDDATDVEISDALGASPAQKPERTWTDAAVDSLPAVAGAAGGIIGGIGGTVGGFGVGGAPGAIGGAAVGGAAGESARQLINRARGKAAPATSMDAAKDIGVEGAVQGASEAAGGAVAKGATVVGRGLVENAVRPTMAMVRDFPNVVDTIVKERLPVGRMLPGMAKGSEQALAKLATESASVKALLSKATSDGMTFATSKIAEPVLGLIDDIAKQPIGDAQMKTLENMLDEFMKRNPGPLTPLAVKDLKSRAQAVAKPIYKAMGMGMPVSADQTVAARFNGAVASGAKSALETIDGVGAGETEKQGLIGASRALKTAENRRLSLAGEVGSAVAGNVAGTVADMLSPDSSLDSKLKNGAVAWLVARGMASPRTMSRAGLALTAPQIEQLFRQFPRLAVAAIEQAQGQPATSPTTK